MLLLAHAGHWLVQLIYLVPLAVLVGVLLASKLRDRREARVDSAPADDDGAPPAA